MNDHRSQAVARLNSEAAPDLSDASIEAAIGPCVGGRKFVALVKQMRDVGILTTADLWHLESGHDVGKDVRIPAIIPQTWRDTPEIPQVLGGTPQATPQATPHVTPQAGH